MSTEQEKFDAMKVKGYKNLNMEERKEYSELKTKLEGEPKAVVLDPPTPIASVVPPTTEISSEEDRIARLEKMVESLSNENTNLKHESAKMQEGWAEYEPVKDRNKNATLKVYRKDADSPVGVITKLVTFKNNAFNEESRKNDKLVFSLTVTYDDGKEEEIKMDAMEFAELQEIEKVEIMKEDSKVLKKVDGFINAPELDKDKFPKRILSGGSGYGMNVGATKVPLEVFRVESTVTVKRSNGQELQLEAKYLNL